MKIENYKFVKLVNQWVKTYLYPPRSGNYLCYSIYSMACINSIHLKELTYIHRHIQKHAYIHAHIHTIHMYIFLGLKQMPVMRTLESLFTRFFYAVFGIYAVFFTRIFPKFCFYADFFFVLIMISDVYKVF